MLPFYQHLREVDHYKDALADHLRVILGHWSEVRTEWDAILYGERSYFPPRPHQKRRMYSPAVDIAVGPFATERRYIGEYDELLRYNEPFFHRLVVEHFRNVENFRSDFPGPELHSLQNCNENARCLVAIEIEKGNTAAKYLIGSALNAAALGRVGIVVCWSDARLEALLRIREYLSQLVALEKNVFSTRNLLVLHRDQIYREHHARRA